MNHWHLLFLTVVKLLPLAIIPIIAIIIVGIMERNDENN